MWRRGRVRSMVSIVGVPELPELLSASPVSGAERGGKGEIKNDSHGDGRRVSGGDGGALGGRCRCLCWNLLTLQKLLIICSYFVAGTALARHWHGAGTTRLPRLAHLERAEFCTPSFRTSSFVRWRGRPGVTHQAFHRWFSSGLTAGDGGRSRALFQYMWRHSLINK